MARNKLPFDYRSEAGIYMSALVKGTAQLSTTEDVVLDATLTGTIYTSGFCEITENGLFDGDIESRAVTIFGTTNGEVTAADTIHIKRSAQIKGVYSSPTILIEPGAIVNARIVHTQSQSSGPL